MNFRTMRRNRQQLTPEECQKILDKSTSGVLSLIGDGGYPYGVPMSYVYHDGKIFSTRQQQDTKLMQSAPRKNAHLR